MTGVTVVDRIEAGGNLGMEIVQCTFTDGYTYASKFGTVVGVVANGSARVGTWASWSGRTVTLHCTSASGDTGTIVIFGR